MQPLALLMEEHRTIERVLEALARFVERGDREAPGARQAVQGFATFLREFADRLHHGKEEDILFRAMEGAGLPREAGPLAVMLSEHTEGRARTAAIAAIGARREPTLDEAEWGELRRESRAYVALLRAHIQKEDQVLYPMADQMLPDAAWGDVTRAFEHFERDPENAQARTRLEALAADLFRLA